MQSLKTMLPLKIHFEPQGSEWLAIAPELNIATQGENFEKAQANLQEALSLFFESCLRRGTLEQVLKDAGIQTVRRKAVQQSLSSFILDSSPVECHA